MSKPTDEFWHSFGWCLILLGFFGGIALVVLAANRPDPGKQTCLQSKGTWIRKDANSYGLNGYYTCEYDPTKIIREEL